MLERGRGRGPQGRLKPHASHVDAQCRMLPAATGIINIGTFLVGEAQRAPVAMIEPVCRSPCSRASWFWMNLACGVQGDGQNRWLGYQFAPTLLDELGLWRAQQGNGI